MTDDEDRDSLSPHPFGMPEDHRPRPPWLIPALIAGVVAVVLVAAAVGFALLRRPAPPHPASAAAASSNAQTGGTSSSTTTPGSATSSPTSSAPSSAASQPVPSQPLGSGAKLTTVTTPPEHTVAMIVVPRGFAGADFAVVLSPYGVGPTGAAGGVLFAKILASKPGSTTARTLGRTFAGMNVALYCSPQVLSAVASGGKYAGTMRVRPQGDVGVLILVSASAAK